MEEIRSQALFVVGRSVMFAFLAIGLLILALASEPVFALKLGGTLSLVLCAVLLGRSAGVTDDDLGTRHLWSMLTLDRQPKRGEFSRIVAAVMAETYLRFARWASGAAAVFFAGALLVRGAL